MSKRTCPMKWLLCSVTSGNRAINKRSPLIAAIFSSNPARKRTEAARRFALVLALI